MSKLVTHCGLHPSGLSELLSAPAAADQPLPFLYGLDINLRSTIDERSPSTLFIFRTQIFGPDNGNMYSGDPIAAGRAWVDTLYPILIQNEADYYSIINEPGRSDVFGLTWLCNFYLGAMQRADELGIKLAIGGWSTGMPPINVADSAQLLTWVNGVLSGVPQWAVNTPMESYRYRQLRALQMYHREVVETNTYFSAIATDFFGTAAGVYIDIYTPMMRYAVEHGHILELHEYSLDGPMLGSPLCLRYRQLYAALPPDARPLLAITEAGPGAGYDTGYEMESYISVVADYDTEIMKDRYALGAALYHHGTGESDLSEAVPLLTEYIVTHPTPAQGGDMAFIFGVHATAAPGPMLTGDTAGITAAQKFNGYKFLTGDPPAHYAQVAALGLPPANCITRLFVDFRGRTKPTPAQFCDEQRLAIQEAMAAGVVWFEIHNEPNLGAAYGNAAEWPYSDDAHDFIDWVLQVIPILRANHAGIKLISPGLSPQPNTPQWWIDMGQHGVFDAVDAIGAHVYWPNRSTMLTQEQGLNFIPLLPMSSASKPIFITEFANNQPTDPDREKGLQYVDWMNYIMAHYPTVTRAYLYIISSSTTSDNTTRQTIVRSGVVSEIAAGIAAGIVAPPVTYRFEHSHLDGGASDGSNPRQIVMNANHTLEANWTLIAPPVSRFFLTVNVSPPGSGVVTLNPPQPTDGYPEGTIVTATFSPA